MGVRTKNAIIITVIFAAAAAGILLLRGLSGEDSWVCVDDQWTMHGHPAAPMPTSGCGVLFQTVPDNFEATGNVIKDNPGLIPGTWYLSYETPGRPALTFRLSFQGGEPPLFQGERVTVHGFEENNTLVVRGVSEVVQLFYYDPKLDMDKKGNVLCSAQGLIPVSRAIEISSTSTAASTIGDAVKTLIVGGLTQKEKARGITTEYPLSGFTFTGASLENGALTLSFSDPENRSSGGSCRAKVLWLQIERTASQFPGVTSVSFSPADIFQP